MKIIKSKAWRRGTPPIAGWYPASTCGNRNIWRWWNGRHWSVFVTEHANASDASACARHRSFESLEGKNRVRWLEWRYE